MIEIPLELYRKYQKQEAQLATLTKRVKEAEEHIRRLIIADMVLNGKVFITLIEARKQAEAFLSTPTSPDLVLVRKGDLEDALRILNYGFVKFNLPTPCLEDSRSLDRLKAALTNKSKDSQGEQLLSIF